jgi:hypothetical protein
VPRDATHRACRASAVTSPTAAASSSSSSLSAQPQLGLQAQRRACGRHDCRRARACAGSHDAEHLDGLAPRDRCHRSRQRRPVPDTSCRAASSRSSSVAFFSSPAGAPVRSPDITRQLCPHQPARLAASRRCPHDAESPAPRLVGRSLGEGRLPRPSRAGDNEQATLATRRAPSKRPSSPSSRSRPTGFIRVHLPQRLDQREDRDMPNQI